MKWLNVTIFLLLIISFSQCGQETSVPLNVLSEIPVLDVDFAPKKYVAYKTETPIEVDGDLTESEWASIEWTSEFDDMQGDKNPESLYSTKVKMVWDDDYFYIGAEMIEPHIWATLTDHDDIIFTDHAFEIFMDPDGDTHNYGEIEMNAFETIWDLILTKPYRDNGEAVNSWHIDGLKKAVKIYGTINNPSDEDERWTVEMAIPWNEMKEIKSDGETPENGEQWRVNFLRVNWQLDITNNTYEPKISLVTNRRVSAFNWVWAVTGNAGLHVPERWGFVQFSDKQAGTDQFSGNPNDEVKWALRQVYYRQKAFMEEYQEYAASADQLQLENLTVDGLTFAPEISLIDGAWQARQEAFNDKTAYIRQDGKVWLE